MPTPNRGAMVRATSADDLDDLYQLRALLEGYAARRAARASRTGARRAACELRALRQRSIPRRAERARRARTSSSTSSILEAAGSERLAEHGAEAIELPLVYRSYIWYSPDQRRISAHYHRQIAGALEARDAERAELVMKEHVFEARDILVARMRELSEDGE